MISEAKLLTLALCFIARQGLLEKFTQYLACYAKNEKAQQNVEHWLASNK